MTNCSIWNKYHASKRLAQKIKNSNVKFIKQVPSHLQDRLAHKTRDVYDDMEPVITHHW